MNNRRDFLKRSIALTAGVGLIPAACFSPEQSPKTLVIKVTYEAKLIATWNHGIEANNEGWRILDGGGSILDAVEKGVMIVEADPTGTTVGIGGTPDRDGNVTLDACIMDKDGNAGSVCFLQNIKHPISIARKVMEETPHVMLAGTGALKFAIEQGFQEENLLTEASEKAWKEWLKTSKYNPKVNRKNHDTIGMLGIDSNGDLAGSCTTSGMGYKMQGRVGDSPIIGAGLYVDNEVGGAVATGNGELMMKTLGSFLVVELMKQGANAQEACEEAIDRIVKKYDYQQMQVGYLALDKSGNTGAYAITGGFNYAETLKGETNLIDSKSFI